MVKKKILPKKSGVKKVNPFELKFNRQKHDVLGKKKNSSLMGHPGLSKKKAYEQREKTLGVEHARVGVVNKILDRRLGEKDERKSSEEKASMRFTAERMKTFKKTSKFNLANDEDLLTHEGHALTSIQKYDRTLASDDEDDDSGALGADVVKMAHFGGGEEEDNGKPKTRKDLIADLIARTKQARQEKASAKDEQEIATDNLDDKYKKLLGKVTASFRPIGATKEETVEKDDYDKLALALKIDSDNRATPAERTKSEEEKAADEKARLEDLENARLARMNAKENKKRHLPVDVDVDPEAAVNRKREKKKSGFEVRFDETGQLMDKDKIQKGSILKVALDSDAEDEDEEDRDSEDLDDLLDGDDEEEEGSNDEEDVNDEEDESDAEDEDEEEDEDMENDKELENIEDNTDNAVLSEDASLISDIPFVFDMPSSFAALEKLVEKHGFRNAAVVLERIVKCHHPSLKDGNKELMKKLFLYVLRLYDEVSKKRVTSESVFVLGTLIKSMFSLMKFNLEYAVRCVRAFVRQTWRERIGEKRRRPISFTVIALLRLVAGLFPVSDAWHPVCSPSITLAALCLGNGLVTSLSALARQLLLLTTITDFVDESKRYIPEAVAFLQGAVTLAVENKSRSPPSNVFPISAPHNSMLVIRKKTDSEDSLKPLALGEVFNADSQLEDTDANRCRVLRALLGIVRRFRVLYAVHEETFTMNFTPILVLLKEINSQNLPAALAEDLDSLIKSVEGECNLRSKLVHLSQRKTEKSMLKMLEPVFEENFDPERPRMSRDSTRKGKAAENSKLHYMYKKEMRGAVRELRKDGAYLSRKQRQDTAWKDRDRREKTKRLMADLQCQQGEWNKELRETGKDRKKK